MMETGCLDSGSQLVSIDGVPGFVLVKWSSENQTIKFPHKDGFVDGFQVKQLHADRMQPMCDANSFFTDQFNTEPDSASIQAQVRIDLGDKSSLFNDSLKYVETLQTGENKMKNFAQYYEWVLNNASNVFNSVLSEVHMPLSVEKSYFQDYYSILSPAFCFRLPADHLRKAESILNFYFKYRLNYSSFAGSFGNCEDSVQCDPWSLEVDYVPSLKLDFWPRDMHWFLDRLKMNRPLLFEKIEPIHMHIIPKWSGKTTEANKNLEFHYSFSAIEMKLAEERSLVEQILNQVARGLFYKYLHTSAMVSSSPNKKNLPSYFVKTTVLWMCEKENLESIYSVTAADSRETEKIIATRLANRWIAHVCVVLKSRDCPHYFIKNYNILEGFSGQYLDILCHILQNDVNLEDDRTNLTETDFTRFNAQIDTLNNNMIGFLENMDDESQFFLDSIKLYNEFMHGLKLDIGFFDDDIEEISDDDDNHEDNDGDDDNDDDIEFTIITVEHCYKLLEMMARYDNSEMNNWQLWRKLFITDVSEQAPVLRQHVKTTRSTILLAHSAMLSVLAVKEVDRYISDREFNIKIENPLSLPILQTGDIISLALTRMWPMISQQLTNEPYRQTIVENPANILAQFVEIFGRYLPEQFKNVLYSEQIELIDEATLTSASTKIHPVETKNKSLATQMMEEEPTLSKKEFVILINQSRPFSRPLSEGVVSHSRLSSFRHFVHD